MFVFERLLDFKCLIKLIAIMDSMVRRLGFGLILLPGNYFPQTINDRGNLPTALQSPILFTGNYTKAYRDRDILFYCKNACLFFTLLKFVTDVKNGLAVNHFGGLAAKAKQTDLKEKVHSKDFANQLLN